MAARYVALGTSPFVDTSVTVGPFSSFANAERAAKDMEHLGYVTEICRLARLAELVELGPVVNDEGSEVDE